MQTASGARRAVRRAGTRGAVLWEPRRVQTSAHRGRHDVYDVFVSYSHAADGRLAPQLQAALGSLGKPWHKRRALRVFRDTTSLAASPELWPMIERALEVSRYFVLLASPAAADSVWVQREVAWWREHRSTDSLLIVATSGELSWDDTANDFTPASAVPSSARGWLASEPLWVDLRWAHDEEHVSPRNPRFRDAAAELAAPVHGIDKDELVGEDVRQHRRAVRLARGAVASISVLALVAIAAGFVADQQRRQANTQRDEARRQAADATSVALATLSGASLTSRPDVSVALAYAAYTTSPRPEARAAAVDALIAARSSGHRGVLDDRSAWALAFTPSDALAAVEEDGVSLWDTNTGRRVTRHRLPPGDLLAASFSSDAASVAIATTDAITVMRTADGRRLARIRAADVAGDRGGLAWSPSSGTLAVATTGDAIELWHPASHRRPTRLRSDAVSSVSFDAEGTALASGSDDGTVSLWSTPPRRRPQLKRRIGVPAPLPPDDAIGAPGNSASAPTRSRAVRLSPDGALVAVAAANGTRLLKADDGTRIARVASVSGAVAFSPDGSMLAVDDTAGIRLFDTAAGRQAARLTPPSRGPAPWFGDLAFSRTGKLLASVAWYRKIRLWNADAHAKLTRRKADSVLALDYQPRATRLAVAGNEGVRIWNPLTHERRALLSSAGAEAIVYAPDGQTLATAGADGTQLWSAASGKRIARLSRQAASDVAFSSDGGTLAAAQAQRLEYWDTGTRRRAGVIALRGDPLVDGFTAVALSPDGRTIGSVDGVGVDLWNATTRERIHHFAARALPAIAFSPAGDLFAYSSEAVVHVRDARTGGLRGSFTIDGPDDDVLVGTLRFSADAKILAVGSSDGVELRDPYTRKRIGKPLSAAELSKGASGVEITAVAISPDGRSVVASDSYGELRFWTDLLWTTDAQLQASVCELVGHGLSRADWSRFAPGIPYHRVGCR